MENIQSEELKEFNRLYRELDRLYHEIAVKAELSDSAFYILYAIIELGDGCMQKEISENYFLSKQTINSSIQNLITKGYVSMINGKGHDKHVYLTDEGKNFVMDKIYPVMKMESEVFTEMTREESCEMLRLYRKYIRLFQNKLNGGNKSENTVI